MLRKITLHVILFSVIGVCAYSQQATPTPQPYKWILVKTGDNLHSNKDRSLWTEADRNEDMRASFKHFQSIIQILFGNVRGSG